MIGAGPNGLVAANLLADEGWDVVVLEAGPEPGGAVRSGELTLPGWTHDLFSAFYPLAAGDGDAWRELYELWRRTGDAVVAAIMEPLVPIGPVARLTGGLRTNIPSFVRFGRMKKFEYDHSTVQVDWALDGPVPWAAPEARRSAAVHVGGSMEEMVARVALAAHRRASFFGARGGR